MAENRPGNILPFRQRIRNQDSTTAESETTRQYRLIEGRAARKGGQEIERLRTEVRPPDVSRYFLGFVLTAIGDVLDIVAVVLIVFFGVSIPVGWVVDIIIDVPLLLLGFASSKKLKKTGAAASAITEKIQNLEQKVVQYRRRYAMAIQAGRKVTSLREPIRQFTKKFKGGRKIITKSPIGKLLWSFLGDFIPVLDLIPFRTIAMRSMYKQEKVAYQEFQRLIDEDYREAQKESEEEFAIMATEQKQAYEEAEESPLAA